MLGQTAPWVGLETSTCNAAPLNTSKVLTSHSALSTYIAGFALAGFILLLSRNDDGISEHKRRAHANASLLLALAAIAGLVCAFLFSSLNAFHCLSVQSSSVYASLLLIIGAMLLVAGISVVAAAEPSIGNTATILRVILFLGGLIMASRLFFDFQNADRTTQSYRHLVAALNTTDGSTKPALDPGSTTSLDRQLGSLRRGEMARSVLRRVALTAGRGSVRANARRGSDRSAPRHRVGRVRCGARRMALHEPGRRTRTAQPGGRTAMANLDECDGRVRHHRITGDVRPGSRTGRAPGRAASVALDRALRGDPRGHSAGGATTIGRRSTIRDQRRPGDGAASPDRSPVDIRRAVVSEGA